MQFIGFLLIMKFWIKIFKISTIVVSLVILPVSSWPFIGNHFIKDLRKLSSIDIRAIVGLFGRFEVKLNLIFSGDLFLTRRSTIAGRSGHSCPCYIPTSGMNCYRFIKKYGKLLSRVEIQLYKLFGHNCQFVQN